MDWIIYLIISVVCFAASVIMTIVRAKAKYKSGRLLSPSKILFVGIIISSLILFIPIYINAFKSCDCGFFETILIAIHNMIRLFLVDGEFQFITTNLVGVSDWVYKGYTILFAIPVVGFILLIVFAVRLGWLPVSYKKAGG